MTFLFPIVNLDEVILALPVATDNSAKTSVCVAAAFSASAAASPWTLKSVIVLPLRIPVTVTAPEDTFRFEARSEENAALNASSCSDVQAKSTDKETDACCSVIKVVEPPSC